MSNLESLENLQFQHSYRVIQASILIIARSGLSMDSSSSILCGQVSNRQTTIKTISSSRGGVIGHRFPSHPLRRICQPQLPLPTRIKTTTMTTKVFRLEPSLVSPSVRSQELPLPSSPQFSASAERSASTPESQRRSNLMKQNLRTIPRSELPVCGHPRLYSPSSSLDTARTTPSLLRSCRVSMRFQNFRSNADHFLAPAVLTPSMNSGLQGHHRFESVATT